MHPDPFDEPMDQPRAPSTRRRDRRTTESGASLALVRPCLLIGLLGLLLSLALVLPGASQAQGNSENAKACLQGGWQHLQTSDGRPFANQHECVTAGAQGAELVPIPTRTP